jgi:hypothetical protein
MSRVAVVLAVCIVSACTPARSPESLPLSLEQATRLEELVLAEAPLAYARCVKDDRSLSCDADHDLLLDVLFRIRGVLAKWGEYDTENHVCCLFYDVKTYLTNLDADAPLVEALAPYAHECREPIR